MSCPPGGPPNGSPGLRPIRSRPDANDVSGDKHEIPSRRREVWKVGDDGDHFVPARVPKNQVVRRVMNDDVVGMIAERADAKGDQQTEPPITEAQLAHAERDRRLHYENRDRDQRSPRIAHHNSRTSGCALMIARARPGWGCSDSDW